MHIEKHTKLIFSKEQRAELARLLQAYGQYEPWKKALEKYQDQGRDMEQYQKSSRS